MQQNPPDNGGDSLAAPYGEFAPQQPAAGAMITSQTIRELLGVADSRGYQSDQRHYFQRPRDLPPLNFYVISQMLVDPTIKLGLKARAAPLCNPYFAWTEDGGKNWNPGVQADSEPVKAFVERQLAKVWEYAGEILTAQVWGWSAGEWTHELTMSGTVELKEYFPRAAYDTRAIARDGRVTGVRVLNCRGRRSGVVDLKFPSALFHAHCPDAGQIYGRRILDGAYGPFADKAFEGGALDVRRLFMHTAAFGGVEIQYPDGLTMQGGRQIPNGDIARQIAERIQSGGVVSLPFSPGQSGENRWKITRATVPSNPTHILDYPKNIDVEILRGLEVPDDILTAESSGAWAGKTVIMQAFYTSLDMWLTGLVRDVVNQVIRPLVWRNFGTRVWFAVKCKPLALVAIEMTQSAGGGGGQQPPGKPQGMGPEMADEASAGNDEAGIERMVGMGLLSAARVNNAARRSVRLRRAMRMAVEGKEENWVTIGGSPSGKAKHAGGFPVQLDGDGNIIKGGPKGLRGKHVSEVKKHFDDQRQIQKKFDAPEFDKGEAQGRLPLGDGVKTRADKQVDKYTQRAEKIQKLLDEAKAARDELRNAKPAEPKVEPHEQPSRGTPPEKPSNDQAYNIDMQHLHADPTRFQYKVKGIGADGVTDELEGVKFNPDYAGVISVWKDPKDGKTYVVNGHHRYDLAKRSGVRDMSVRYIEAENAEQARSVGAAVNIAEGRGAALDAAKWMRDTGKTAADMQEIGISLKGKIAADGSILSKLSDKAFNALAQGRIEEDTAKAVAKHLGEKPELQDELFKELAKKADDGKDLSPRVIEEMAQEIGSAPVVTTKGEDLFGSFEETKSTWAERGELKAHIRGDLGRELNDFAVLSSKRRADAAGGVGENKIDTEANKERRGELERKNQLYAQLVNSKGPIADTINEGAEKYANATTKRERDRIKAETTERVRAAIDGELGRLDRGEIFDTAGGLGSAESTATPGAGTAPSDIGQATGADESGPGSASAGSAGLDDLDAERTPGKQYASAAGQGGLFGDSVEQPEEKPKAPAGFNPKENQNKLFATGGLPGQNNLFDDNGIPDDMVYKPGGEAKPAAAKAATAEASKPTGEEPAGSYDGGKVSVVKHHDDNRLRINFPGKPAPAVISDLKASGFRWSPVAGAWQRFNTPNSHYDAHRILAKHYGEKSE
jgi:hypothetical protein